MMESEYQEEEPLSPLPPLMTEPYSRAKEQLIQKYRLLYELSPKYSLGWEVYWNILGAFKCTFEKPKELSRHRAQAERLILKFEGEEEWKASIREKLHQEIAFYDQAWCAWWNQLAYEQSKEG